jgi:heterodisulfide reductase subunit B
MTGDRFAFFPGCISQNLYPSVERSTRLVMEELGYELVDMPFSCCPPPGVLRSYHKGTWLTLASRNLAVAAREGLPVLTICNGCYGSLAEAQNKLDVLPFPIDEVIGELKEAGIEGAEGIAEVEVLHLLDVLGTEEARERIADAVVHQLGTPVAVHYGCHYLKPTSSTGRDPANPTVLDELIELAGYRSVPFVRKLSCCGAGGGVWSGKEDTSLAILGRKLDDMDAAGAEAIVNVCPFCHLQFDQGQKRLGKGGPTIPSVHLSQLLGLAFGMKDKALGLHTHLVPARGLAKAARDARAREGK